MLWEYFYSTLNQQLSQDIRIVLFHLLSASFPGSKNFFFFFKFKKNEEICFTLGFVTIHPRVKVVKTILRLVSIHPECKKTFFGERIALYNFFECVLFCFGFGLESSSKNIRKNFLWKTIRNYFWPGVQKLHPEIKEFFWFFRPGAR